MMINKKRIENLQAQQAAQQTQINNLSKGILSLCLACGVTAISAARANRKAKGLEVKINGMVVEEEPKKKKKEKKAKAAPEAPKAPKAEQPVAHEAEAEVESEETEEGFEE